MKATAPREKPVERVVQGLLESDEHVIWRGQPLPAYAVWSGFPGNTWWARIGFLLGALLAIQPFSLGGFYLGWVAVQSLFTPTSGASLVAGILMVPVGLALALGPYYIVLGAQIKRYRNAKDLHYAITNRRTMMLVIRHGKVLEQQVKSLADILEPRVKMVLSNGVGDVIYDAGGAFHPEGAGTGYTSHYDVGFEGVPQAEEVLATLQQARANLTRR